MICWYNFIYQSWSKKIVFLINFILLIFLGKSESETMLSVLSVIILMITNNPYNIPERPAKQRKVNLETTPLFPHQLNRSQEPEIKHNHPTRNKQIPFFESTVTEVCRLPMSPQPSLKSHNLQTSNVTQWEGHPHNLFNSSYQSWPDLN